MTTTLGADLVFRHKTQSEASLVRRKLRHGEQQKAVFVRGQELQVYGAHTAIAGRWMLRADWSLAGVYWPAVDVELVLEDIKAVRQEQAQLRDAMQNRYVRVG